MWRSQKYLSPEDHILIIDDFLANGQAALGLMDIIDQARATLTGIGIVIEKSFQEGSDLLRKRNVHLESLVSVNRFVNGKITFKEEGF